MTPNPTGARGSAAAEKENPQPAIRPFQNPEPSTRWFQRTCRPIGATFANKYAALQVNTNAVDWSTLTVSSTKKQLKPKSEVASGQSEEAASPQISAWADNPTLFPEWQMSVVEILEKKIYGASLDELRKLYAVWNPFVELAQTIVVSENGKKRDTKNIFKPLMQVLTRIECRINMSQRAQARWDELPKPIDDRKGKCVFAFPNEGPLSQACLDGDRLIPELYQQCYCPSFDSAVEAWRKCSFEQIAKDNSVRDNVLLTIQIMQDQTLTVHRFMMAKIHTITKQYDLGCDRNESYEFDMVLRQLEDNYQLMQDLSDIIQGWGAFSEVESVSTNDAHLFHEWVTCNLALLKDQLNTATEDELVQLFADWQPLVEGAKNIRAVLQSRGITHYEGHHLSLDALEELLMHIQMRGKMVIQSKEPTRSLPIAVRVGDDFFFAERGDTPICTLCYDGDGLIPLLFGTCYLKDYNKLKEMFPFLRKIGELPAAERESAQAKLQEGVAFVMQESLVVHRQIFSMLQTMRNVKPAPDSGESEEFQDVLYQLEEHHYILEKLHEKLEKRAFGAVVKQEVVPEPAVVPVVDGIGSQISESQQSTNVSPVSANPHTVVTAPPSPEAAAVAPRSETVPLSRDPISSHSIASVAPAPRDSVKMPKTPPPPGKTTPAKASSKPKPVQKSPRKAHAAQLPVVHENHASAEAATTHRTGPSRHIMSLLASVNMGRPVASPASFVSKFPTVSMTQQTKSLSGQPLSQSSASMPSMDMFTQTAILYLSTLAPSRRQTEKTVFVINRQPPTLPAPTKKVVDGVTVNASKTAPAKVAGSTPIAKKSGAVTVPNSITPQTVVAAQRNGQTTPTAPVVDKNNLPSETSSSSAVRAIDQSTVVPQRLGTSATDSSSKPGKAVTQPSARSSQEGNLAAQTAARRANGRQSPVKGLSGSLPDSRTNAQTHLTQAMFHPANGSAPVPRTTYQQLKMQEQTVMAAQRVGNNVAGNPQLSDIRLNLLVSPPTDFRQAFERTMDIVVGPVDSPEMNGGATSSPSREDLPRSFELELELRRLRALKPDNPPTTVKCKQFIDEVERQSELAQDWYLSVRRSAFDSWSDMLAEMFKKWLISILAFLEDKLRNLSVDRLADVFVLWRPIIYGMVKALHALYALGINNYKGEHLNMVDITAALHQMRRKVEKSLRVSNAKNSLIMIQTPKGESHQYRYSLRHKLEASGVPVS